MLAYGVSGAGPVNMQLSLNGSTNLDYGTYAANGGNQSVSATAVHLCAAGDVLTASIGSNLSFSVLGDPTSNASYLSTWELAP